jgi:hypothetical protein
MSFNTDSPPRIDVARDMNFGLPLAMIYINALIRHLTTSNTTFLEKYPQKGNTTKTDQIFHTTRSNALPVDYSD